MQQVCRETYMNRETSELSALGTPKRKRTEENLNFGRQFTEQGSPDDVPRGQTPFTQAAQVAGSQETDNIDLVNHSATDASVGELQVNSLVELLPSSCKESPDQKSATGKITRIETDGRIEVELPTKKRLYLEAKDLAKMRQLSRQEAINDLFGKANMTNENNLRFHNFVQNLSLIHI